MGICTPYRYKFPLSARDPYKSINIKGTGTTVKGIKQSSLLNACIPLPPFNEQNRIVEKLDKIMDICDQMEAILDGSADMVAERIY